MPEPIAPPRPAELPTLATVTVTYHPEPELLEAQLRQLPREALKVIVDNGSRPELLELVRALAASHPGVVLVENGDNLGLAAALNLGVGIAAARCAPEGLVLLLDQDTEPGEGNVESLVAGFRALRATHPALGAVGPRLRDVGTGLEHGFHRIAGLRWARYFPADATPLPVTNINGSGLLMPIALFQALGGLATDFFIDHVDTEWSFRLLADGRELYGLPGVSFRHRMGERSIRFWLFGWRVWPYRSPARHFFLFRNTVRLLRRPYVPAVWKSWAPVKLGVTFAVHLLFDGARRPQAKQMLRGVLAGLR
jgi:rhamnosyltransferase